MIGASLLPGLSRKVRDAGMELPMPTSWRGAKSRKSPAQEEFILRDFSRSILNSLKRASQL